MGEEHAAWRLEQRHPSVVTVRLPEVASGWEQWFLLRSDAHHDNQLCQQDLERQHLEEALARGAGILDFGDLFCGMQGKWDKRSDTSQLRPELRATGLAYLDALVAYNSAFYAPYAANWVLLSPGNHETAILGRHETDLTLRLAERLRVAGSPVRVGHYAGWVRFLIEWNQTKRVCYRLRYIHGYAGGGQVTRDLIQANRQLVYLGNVDILVSGHTHDQWHVPVRRESLDHLGTPQMQDVDVIKIGGYKDEYSGGKGWAVERGHAPKPIGAYWLRFFMDRTRGPRFEVLRAT